MSRRSVAVTFRFTPEEAEDIDQRAEALNMSRTSYVAAVATGKLDTDPDQVLKHINGLEDRIERLERFVFES